MRRIVSLLLTTAMLFTFAAGASAETAHSVPGTLPIVSEPITLTVGVEQHPSVEDWETNEMTKLLEERTGIQLDFVVFPSGEMGTKLELMVAANGSDLPDILLAGSTAFSQQQIMNWAEAGMILPLTEYWKDLSYYAEESLAVTDTTNLETALKYITSYDGEVYGLFSYNTTYNNQVSGGRLNFYVPWLEKLGLEKPKTLEDLYDVLVAFKNSDPNGNGVADEIPLTSYNDQIGAFRKAMMTPFVYTQNEYWTVDEDGNIGVAFDGDDWREGLRFVRKLFDEGLADPAMFTQDQNALTITLSQETPVVGAYVRFSSTNMAATDPNRYEFDRQDFFGVNGKEAVVPASPSVPGVTGLITKNCKYPEEAFMLMDYMMGIEMSSLTRYGHPRAFTEEELGGMKEVYLNFWKNEAKANYPEIYYPNDTENPEYLPLNDYDYNGSVWGTLQNTWWAQVGPNIMTEELQSRYCIAGSIGTDMDKLSYVNEYRARYACLESVAHMDPSQYVAGLIYTEDEQEVLTDYYTEIKTYVESSWASFAIGTMDINDDATWNEYISTLERMNLSECVQATQAAYDRQIGK